MYVLTNVGTLPLTSSLIRQKLHWLIIRSIFKLQVGYSNESTTFTTAQLNVIPNFFHILPNLSKEPIKIACSIFRIKLIKNVIKLVLLVKRIRILSSLYFQLKNELDFRCYTRNSDFELTLGHWCSWQCKDKLHQSLEVTESSQVFLSTLHLDEPNLLWYKARVKSSFLISLQNQIFSTSQPDLTSRQGSLYYQIGGQLRVYALGNCKLSGWR